MSFRRTKCFFTVTVICCLFYGIGGSAIADEIDDELAMYAEENNGIADPLEPMNRFFFQFNDKMYFYVLKPVAKGYGAVLPEDIRMVIGNAFLNILAPVRVVNNLLQGKFAESGTELLRFVINTTAGAGGLGDPAKEVFHLESSSEDLGQTLGSYGVGEGIYFCWPFLGPSNLRDTVGLVGDAFLNPLTYVSSSDSQTGAGLIIGDKVNKTSLNIGEYEQFIETSFDPYVAMRDFYTQSRRAKIKDNDNDSVVVNDLDMKLGDIDEMPERSDDTPLSLSAAKDEVHNEISDSPKHYFVQVSVSDNINSIEPMIDRLVSMNKNPVIMQFQQDNYSYYGLMVLAGDSQSNALAEEAMLSKNGFDDVAVVRL